mmetsp:Transcript_77041/g.152659  ORF Transcript_77041/g.152659 Transcript_77041/m.152659 type:complete len:104 (+) Transcript_77041:239-550(+)
MVATNTTEDQKKDLAPPIAEPTKGPTPKPRPKAAFCLASQTANWGPVNRSLNAADTGALKATIIEPEIILSTKLIGKIEGKAATRVCRKASIAGGIKKKGLRP